MEQSVAVKGASLSWSPSEEDQSLQGVWSSTNKPCYLYLEKKKKNCQKEEKVTQQTERYELNNYLEPN